MGITGFWQMSWTVPDLDRAVAFYRDGLGLTLRHTQIGDNEYTRKLVGYPDAKLRTAQFNITGVDPGVSGHLLELVEYVTPVPDADNSPETYNDRVAHVAFVVDDIEDMCRRVNLHGGRTLSDPVAIEEGINTGGRAVYARDPQGFTIELVEPPKMPGTPSVGSDIP